VRLILAFFGIGAFFFLWVAAVAELVGLPVAWWKLRRTEAWRRRPRDVRAVDLLESYIRPILWETGPVAVAVLALVALLTWALGLGDTVAAGVAASLVLLAPAALVGVAVSRLDPREFERVVAERQAAAGRSRSGASHSGGSTGGIFPG
jgi:hypothetical protein